MALKANILGCCILLYVSLDFEKSSSSCLGLDSLSSNKASHSTSLGSRFYLGKHLSVENDVNCKIFYSLRRQNLWVLMPISQQAYIRKKRCYGNLGQESKDMYYIRAINTYTNTLLVVIITTQNLIPVRPQESATLTDTVLRHQVYQ